MGGDSDRELNEEIEDLNCWSYSVSPLWGLKFVENEFGKSPPSLARPLVVVGSRMSSVDFFDVTKGEVLF